MNKILAKLVLGIGLVFILAACNKAENIEGEVKDVFGKPLQDVTVEIEKTSFSSKTNGSGSYSIDYVPGAFNVKFSKAGYTTQKLELNIQQKAHFPAQPMVLYPVPSDEGFYCIYNNDLMKFSEGKIIEQQIKDNNPWNFTEFHFKYFADVASQLPELPRGKLTFIDNVPKPLYLVRLNESGLIWEGILGAFRDSTRKDMFFKPIKDTSAVIGEEKVQVRTVELPPGLYAWVEARKTISVGIMPKFDGALFTFRVDGTPDQRPDSPESSAGNSHEVSPQDSTSSNSAIPNSSEHAANTGDGEGEGCEECEGDEPSDNQARTNPDQQKKTPGHATDAVQIKRPTTWAPSFSCARASNHPERLICSSKELSDADMKMAQLYKTAAMRVIDKNALKREQNIWRKYERDVCANIDCILDAYNARIRQLAQMQ